MRRIGSPAGKLDVSDGTKLAVGAALAACGGVAAWFGKEAIPALEENGGTLALLVAVIVPVLLNTLRKWLTDTRQEIQKPADEPAGE